ncbi:FAD-binding protein [Frankia sp. CNm7]|uniref:FAD-binding protein n=1 Tax=Frankia nepalensis TaxID=1836974 RepID=A0A937RNI9_9ACTN|nr:D-arabinono-1,4-lactone oxidase [Frankia nepalensis]MBL7499575.1 FAD-binding protein [Frankia nepalensis]MBL7513064.1 FAD-binding protein [Frankia nepalensis]MBL7522900.1 FAD-binding protein [Frankia nepalensis]MBL7633777.1 FAD-binding protein [Frankia nepalensis]
MGYSASRQRTGSPAAASWSNWAGNQVATPAEVAHPADADDVAALVRKALGSGARLRPIGSGHSFTGIGRPDGPATTQLMMDRCADLLALDAGSGLVTVGAGMTLRRLNRLLAEAGLALTNLGDVDLQTVAGALATGTHGTGARFGGLATQVRAFELVRGDGEIVLCSAREHPELFAAARVGLGAVGVVTSVTLQAVPQFALRAEEGSTRLAELLDGLDEFVDGADHAEFFWFPHTDRVLTKRNTRVPYTGAESLDPLPRMRGWLDDELLSNRVFALVVAAGRRVPRTIGPVARLSSRALGARTFTDLSHKVFVSERRVRFKEMEYAVARTDLAAVLRELTTAVERSGLRISFPVEARVAAADEIWLSTAHGRQTGYVAVHVDHRSPHEEYFALVEKIMTAAGGRPHWGKLHTQTAETLRPRYPKFDDFLAVRAGSDPAGLFTNDYLDQVLGPVQP